MTSSNKNPNAKAVNLKRVVSGSVDALIPKLTEELKKKGFGVLTRIDFHEKIKEKLNKDIPKTVVLGACNPHLAYEAYCVNPDVTSLIPCNAVLRDVGNNQVSLELALPSQMMEALGDKNLASQAEQADKLLAQVLEVL